MVAPAAMRTWSIFSTRSSNVCAWNKPSTAAPSPISTRSGSGRSSPNPPPKRVPRPIRAPAARRRCASHGVPSSQPASSAARTFQATQWKSQRLAQPDHRGCAAGCTRPSSSHLRATAAAAGATSSSVAFANGSSTATASSGGATATTWVTSGSQSASSSAATPGNAKRRSSQPTRSKRRGALGRCVRPAAKRVSTRRGRAKGGWPNHDEPAGNAASPTVATPSKMPSGNRTPAGITAPLPTKLSAPRRTGARVSVPRWSRGPPR